jgi:hypothetical protein
VNVGEFRLYGNAGNKGRGISPGEQKVANEQLGLFGELPAVPGQIRRLHFGAEPAAAAAAPAASASGIRFNEPYESGGIVRRGRVDSEGGRRRYRKKSHKKSHKKHRKTRRKVHFDRI